MIRAMQKKNFTLTELATLTESRLVGDPTHTITNVDSLESATNQDASFLANPRYEAVMRKSQAGVVFVSPTISLIDGRNFLVNENPSIAFQKVIEIFHGDTQELSGFTEIHPTAVVHPSCKIGEGVSIGPHAVIDKNVTIGNRTSIGSGCYIGPHTTVGEDCILHPHVTIRERCVVGNRVILQPSVVIGGCGFGYTTNAQGKHTKLNQVGTVVIEDDVEIGSNATIDRARFKSTRIRRGTKIDNLVQIGHAVEIGEDNLIVAQTGIAGSTVTGKNVVIGGQVAVAGHLKIGSGVMLAGRTGVDKSLLEPGKYGGVPVQPLHKHNRTTVHLRNIETYVNQIKELQKILGKKNDHAE